MSDQPSEEELEANRIHRESMAARIDESIEVVEGQLTAANAANDEKSANRLRGKLPSLRDKRDEVLSGKRT